MYRVQASCKRHRTHNNMLMLLFRDLQWKVKVIDQVCRIECDFDSIKEAQQARRKLELEVIALERRIKPMPGYGIIFSNAFWVSDPIAVKE